MKILALCIFIAVLMLTLLITPVVRAHIGGVSLLKINGELTKLYYESASTPSFFNIPLEADLAPQNYVVNIPLNFEIDVTKLPTPADIFEKTIILWDFGDGSPIQKIKNGSKQTYTYAKTGTFTLSISADYSEAGFKNVAIQPLQIVIINIVPNKEYQLPKAAIKINNQFSSQTGKKEFGLDLNNRVVFDASESQSGTGKIIEYTWNFGQGNKESRKKIDQFRYQLPLYYVSAALRVKDENGYFSDVFIDLANTGKNEANNPEKEDSQNFFFLLLGVVGGVSVILFGSYLLIIKFLRK